MSKPVLQIVIASTRPGRVGLPVGQWFEARARAHDGFEVQVVDLLELALPFLDEPNHPRLQQYTRKHTRDWSAKVAGADAFAFVIPEYNHGIPATLKNAIDFLHVEWANKPAGVVSYGGVSAGTRSGAMLKQVLLAVEMYPLFAAVSIPFVAQFIDDEGELQPNETMQTASTVLLDDLLKVTSALATLRTG
jgi:NAD(P)H-dependent FMN reductase